MVNAFCNLSDSSNVTSLEMLSLTPPGNAVSEVSYICLHLLYIAPSPLEWKLE